MFDSDVIINKPLDLVPLERPRGVIFSNPDNKYRYALWRTWSLTRKPLLFIGLNPSTAGENFDDPTVTRCMVRAQKEGFGGLLVGNLFGYVTPYPSELMSNGVERVGSMTDEYLLSMIESAGRVLCGWGAFPIAQSRAEKVMKMIPKPYCLGITKSGQPKHPLYISYDTPMTLMNKY